MNFVIHDSALPYRLEQIINADRIISCNWNDIVQFGMPQEILIKVYSDYENLRIERCAITDDTIKVLYISDEAPEAELRHMLRIISLFNQTPFIEATIICYDSQINILRGFSNKHIKFIDKTLIHDRTFATATNIVITYGPGAIHFIRQRLPVILIGPYGLGGLITDINFPFFVRCGFMGRPGGTEGEQIPASVFIHEILSFKENNDIEVTLQNNYELVKIVGSQPFSKSKSLISEATELYLKFKHPDERWNLIPRLASNILFERMEDVIALKREIIFDTICTISADDMVFFENIRSGLNFKHLFQLTDLSEEEFWETIYSLSDKKIIVL